MMCVLGLTTLLLTLLGLGGSALGQDPATATTLWEFPNDTWVENIAVRSNGRILTTLATTPELYQVDPNDRLNATLVYSFPNAMSCLGITETTNDVFYIAVGNFSFDTFRAAPGSFSVWRVDMAPFLPGEHPAHIAKVGGDYPASGFFNGLTTLDAEKGFILIADPLVGVVFRMDVNTGALVTILADPLLSPNNTAGPTGVNGIKIRDSTLFFTNTNRNLYAEVPILTDGTAAGSATAFSSISLPDDLTIAPSGSSYVIGSDTLWFVPPAGGAASVVVNSTLLLGSTAVAFGRTETDSHSLYVSTSGGREQFQTKNFTSPGKVVRIDLGSQL